MINRISQITDIESVAQRFWSHVHQSDAACWPWTLSTSKSGYGKFRVCLDGVKHDMRAHRMSYLLTTGFLPDPPIIIRHNCHNRLCCNPDHLEPGTHQDNMDDMVKSGRAVSGLKIHPERAARGSRNGNTKLTEAKIVQIYQLRREGWTFQRIANHFNVTKHLIICITKGEIWRHVYNNPFYGIGKLPPEGKLG